MGSITPSIYGLVSTLKLQTWSNPQKLQARENIGAASTINNTFSGLVNFSGTDTPGLQLKSLTTAQITTLASASALPVGSILVDSTTDRIDARLARGTVELVDTAGGQTINGTLTVGGTLLSTGQVRGASVWFGGISQANTKLYGSASGQLFIYNSAESAGVMIDVNSNSAASRNLANNADAPITCSNLTASGTVTANQVFVGGSGGARLHNNGGGTVEVFQNNGVTLGTLTAGACRTNAIQRDIGDVSLVLYNSNFSVAGFCIRGPNGSYLNSSGITGTLHLNPTINQTGTAGSTDLLINRTQTALGSGAHNFADFQVGGVSRFSVSNAGNLTASGTLRVGGGTVVQTILSATATLNFPSISSNDTHTLTITVTGAVAGDSVFLGVPATLEAGLIFCASVTAADTVTVQMHNSSGGSVDPASGTFRATVIRF
jgi:hypothetical protein